MPEFCPEVVSRLTLFAGKVKGPYRVIFRRAEALRFGFKCSTVAGAALYDSGTNPRIMEMSELCCLFTRGAAVANDATSKDVATENLMLANGNCNKGCQDPEGIWRE
jgi:hypothetical protein